MLIQIAASRPCAVVAGALLLGFLLFAGCRQFILGAEAGISQAFVQKLLGEASVDLSAFALAIGCVFSLLTGEEESFVYLDPKVIKSCQDIIDTAGDWYRMKETSEHKKYNLNMQPYSLPRMGFAKRAAADDANLCEVIDINPGESSKKFIDEFLRDNQFETQYRRQLELMSAEGTAACYVYLQDAELYDDGSVKGGTVRLNYVEASGFLPITIVNDEVLEAAFWGDHIKGGKKKTGLVIFVKDGDNYTCESVVFDDGVSAPVSVITKLGDIKPFAVMRTAEVNSIANMQGYGFPKVYANIPLFFNLDAAFGAFFTDIDKSEAITFINEQLVDFDDDLKPISNSDERKKRFVFLGEGLPDSKMLIHNEQPNVRIEQFRQSIELLLDILSMKFGFGTKRYSFQDGQVQTATEYIGERQDMMLELNKQRQQSRQYIEDIVRAVAWFANQFTGSTISLDSEIKIEFDDSYIEDRTAKIEAYRQDALSGLGGAHTRALYLAEMYNLDEKEAALWAGDDGSEPPEEGA